MKLVPLWVLLMCVTACDDTTRRGSDGGETNRQVVQTDPVGGLVHTLQAVGLTVVGVAVLFLLVAGAFKLLERALGRKLV